MSRSVDNPALRLGFVPADPIALSDGMWESLACSLGLTGRELEVVRSLFQAESEADIGADLGISPHTVHSHLDRIHRKLGVTSRVALVVRVFSAYLRLEHENSSEELPDRENLPSPLPAPKSGTD